MNKRVGAFHKKALIIFLITAPFAFFSLAMIIGRYPLPLPVIVQILWFRVLGLAGRFPDIYGVIVWDIRLPRALLGIFVGASLAVSGTAFQGLFRNPLVSAGTLGVSAGAGFGASLAILLFNSTALTYLFAFIFGILAVTLSYLIGRFYSVTPTITLVLGGIIVSSVFSSLVSLAKYAADPYEQLPAIVFWLMGSLASARYSDIVVAGIPMTLGIMGLVAVRWQINVLSMGDREARALGVNTTITRGIVLGCATLATAGAVCVSGIIGWVGLVIPHIGRMLVGNDNRRLIPASISLGACFLLLVDVLARTISGSEMPLSILTALLGGPFFVYLLKKTKGGGW
jgi:iron complex transport system permease protein